MKDIIAIIFGIVVVVVVAMVIAGIVALPVMWTWNYVMPDIFGLPRLDFWQALWGTVLVKMLFPSASATVTKK